MKVSIREMMAITAVIALGIGGMIFGRELAIVATVVMFAIVIGVLIVTCVSRGSYRSFGIGFLIPAVSYGLLVYLAGAGEFELFGGKLPTTRLMQRFLMGSYDGRGISGTRLQTLMRNAEVQMPLAHMLFVVVAGYVGGRFAIFMHGRGAEPLSAAGNR